MTKGHTQVLDIYLLIPTSLLEANAIRFVEFDCRQIKWSPEECVVNVNFPSGPYNFDNNICKYTNTFKMYIKCKTYSNTPNKKH